PAEIFLQLTIARLQRQVNCRQKREQRERKETDRERKRRQPRIEKPTGHRAVFNSNRTRSNRAEYRSQQNRRDDARDRKDQTPTTLYVVTLNVVRAKRERRATQNNPDKQQRDRNVKRRCNCGECWWKRCE